MKQPTTPSLNAFEMVGYSFSLLFFGGGWGHIFLINHPCEVCYSALYFPSSYDNFAWNLTLIP